MNYSDIFFDFDGTLADTIKGIKIAVNNVLKTHGSNVSYNDKEVMNFVGNGSKTLFLKAFKQIEVNDSNIDLYNEFMNEYLLSQVNNLSIFPNVIKTLQNLNKLGINLYIYSNKPQEILDECVKNYFKDISFKLVLGSTTSFTPKPNKKYLLEYFNEHNIDIKKVLYVGDSIVDINFANTLNIDCLIYTYGYGDYSVVLKENPKYNFEKFEDILKIV